MTTEDIIRMAREAGWKEMGDGLWGNVRDGCMFLPALERFAFLVAAAERNRMIADGWRQCAKDQKTTQFCAVVEQARLEEREACARVCEEYAQAKYAATAIRGRTQPWVKTYAGGKPNYTEPDDGNPSF